MHRTDAPSATLPFALSADDRLGHRVHFTAPLVFIRGNFAHGDLRGPLITYENTAKNLPLPATGRLELAPDGSSTDERSTVDIAELRVGAEPSQATSAQLAAAGRLAAHPRLLSVAPASRPWTPSLPRPPAPESAPPRRPPSPAPSTSSSCTTSM